MRVTHSLRIAMVETVEPVTFDGFQDFRGREFLFHGTQITKVGGKGWNGENNCEGVDKMPMIPFC